MIILGGRIEILKMSVDALCEKSSTKLLADHLDICHMGWRFNFLCGGTHGRAFPKKATRVNTRRIKAFPSDDLRLYTFLLRVDRRVA